MSTVNNKNMEKLLAIRDKLGNSIGHETIAIILMVIANLTWPFWFYYVSEHNLSFIETTLARGTAITFSHIIIFWIFGISADYRTWFDLKYVFIRNSIILLHQLIYSQMHYYLPYPINNSISMTGPLFVFVVDYYINSVSINSKQMLGITAGIVGVLITSNSQYIFNLIDQNYEPESTFSHYKSVSTSVKMILIFVTLISNLGWAFAIVIQKKVSHIPGIKISFFLGVQMIFVCSITFLFGHFTFSGYFFQACCFSGFGMSFCQILFISALNMSKNTGILTILVFIYAIPSYILSIVRYHQPINIACLIGLLIMLYGLYMAIFKKNK